MASPPDFKTQAAGFVVGLIAGFTATGIGISLAQDGAGTPNQVSLTAIAAFVCLFAIFQIGFYTSHRFLHRDFDGAFYQAVNAMQNQFDGWYESIPISGAAIGLAIALAFLITP